MSFYVPITGMHTMQRSLDAVRIVERPGVLVHRSDAAGSVRDGKSFGGAREPAP